MADIFEAAARPVHDWAELEARGTLISEAVAPGVSRLSEALIAPAERSCFYLIEGDEADCLIDGGSGLAPSLAGWRRDRSKPLLAIATHSHSDHIGLLHLAARRYGHQAEADVFRDPAPEATQALPWLSGRAFLADGGAVRAETIRQRACPLHVHAGDGDLVELGGRTLELIWTPGHSAGSLTVLDRQNGLLFPGDTVHDGHIFDDIPGADRHALFLSHARLTEVDFRLALPGHGRTMERDAVLARIALHRAERG